MKNVRKDDRLQAYHFTTKQAEAIMSYNHAAGKGFATHQDIQLAEARLDNRIQQVKTELKDEIRQVRNELKDEIRQVKTEMKGEIRQVRNELIDDIRQLRTEMVKLEHRITSCITLCIWAAALFVVAVLVIVIHFH